MTTTIKATGSARRIVVVDAAAVVVVCVAVVDSVRSRGTVDIARPVNRRRYESSTGSHESSPFTRHRRRLDTHTFAVCPSDRPPPLCKYRRRRFRLLNAHRSLVVRPSPGQSFSPNSVGLRSALPT